ncbi:type IX secretion system plug protein [Flavobacterium silvaticum]|uniref:DUF5103 domain-containing protein n=1 Tax=Flavobacterium silvaticum TaxID=1852020 RepID=A0A972FTV3_9FLAO|nr:DUF5103 domain-containing protein [Flavobacterium silvaticum]NMH27485.1 DUF5103 domain-containing protein [Flavobacterium silvaticum]
MTKFLTAALLLVFISMTAQVETEVQPPYNIKSVAFIQASQGTIPIFGLNDAFTIQFDDLFGNEANYYYQIVHCDYDWKPSQLVKSEYLAGFDDLRIQTYTNSFNTLQVYSHYTLSLPNRQTQLRVSGNYMLKILNEDRDVVFSRKFILVEELVSVPLQIKRSRTMSTVNYMHNMDFSIKSQSIIFQNPLRNVKVLLMQNGRFDNAIMNIKPQYTIGNDLIYKYDQETQFWAGNEYLYWENKDVRAAGNGVSRIDSNGSLYNTHLYPTQARGSQPYTYFPDSNGNYFPLNINAENNDVEADYTWVYFSLSAPAYFGNGKIYVNGMFNNYAHSPEYEMEYNEKSALWEKAVVVKQGYTNYQYTIVNPDGNVDNANAIDGNFYQTESNYFVIVYYRENNSRYDRVIGKGVASSTNIIN